MLRFHMQIAVQFQLITRATSQPKDNISDLLYILYYLLASSYTHTPTSMAVTYIYFLIFLLVSYVKATQGYSIKLN